MKKRRYTGEREGFTLVEMLVATAMAGVVMTVMFTMFKTSNRSYILQDYVAEAQQNLRVAMAEVTRDARMSGCGLNLMTDMIQDLRIFDNSAGAYAIIKPITGTNAATGPDSIEIFYGDPSTGEFDATITSPMPAPSSEFAVDETEPFNEYDFVVISDGVTAMLFQVTHVQDAAGRIQHNPGQSVYNPPGGTAWPSNTSPYGTGSRLYNFGQARWVTYYIDNTTDPDHPVLMANLHDGEADHIVADNIEDMQCYYFMDGAVGDTHNPAGNEDHIVAVRISMTARTAEEDPENRIFTPVEMEDRVLGATTPDGYRRRALSTIIRMRNM